MPLSNPPIPQITVQQLAERMAQPQSLQLIDVREPEELAVAQIPGFVNLPLSQFAAWSEQILVQFDPNIETLVLCHHGVRSAQMCAWLQGQGFTQLRNIAGGIDAYSMQVDPSVPCY
ncbi:MAG: rhodanese-related sulfurtransferase [Pegethrix bostrychoides GSE-TBD4-15B]|jgi:rhodanese-related sulfurtransferase|uniref:Rhodanese-related sulfurtransferase n=1 Tax=Pegethrix bostrychoides GSE-TBD4-15B TaxID=2839662 RepID=A0A951PCJ8_9CYAN|nr:rhodanese-related sulfurtransferase [Pegethrix bostrychoides GSE-TBD4-15B]